MTYSWIRRLPIVLLCLFYVLLAGTLSYHFPPVNSDEVSYSVHGYNFLHGAGNRYSLYDDVFAPSVYSLRDATPEISQGLFNGWAALWITALGKSYWHARLSSVGAGLLVLLIFYVLGCRIEGPVTGSVAAALLVFNPIFLISSAIVRPEMLLLLLMGLVFWFIYGTRDTFPWKFYLIGLCSGLAMGIHHNSAPVLLGLLAFQFRIKPGLFRLKPMCSVAAGFLSGMICLLLSFDLFKLYAIQKYFFNEFYSLPLLSFPWHPLAWLYDLGRSFVTGITYYFQTDRPLWQTAIHFWIAGVVLGLAGLFTALMDRHADHDRRALKQALLSGFIITFIAMAAMLRKKEVLYASALFPFIVPGTALFLASLVQVGKKRNTFQKLIGAGACCVILASFLCFLAFVINYTKLYMPYTTMVREVQSKIDHAEEKRVLAPAIFWFGWKSLLFRDLGACFKSHWYTGGGRDLKSWLEPWRPDIIVVDTSLWRHIFLDRKPSSMTMSEALGEPVDYVATVDTGLTSGPLEIYLIHWDHATAS